jgi:hypothetical protein
MDGDRAALRETWRVWGRLLETAETPMEQAIARPAALRSARPRRLAAAAILAATVAIVAATAWIASTAQRADDVTSLPETGTPANANVPLVVARRPPTAPSTGESQWDDVFDDQIAQVGRELICVQQDWSLRVDAFDLVRSRLEEIHAEIETGQL